MFFGTSMIGIPLYLVVVVLGAIHAISNDGGHDQVFRVPAVI